MELDVTHMVEDADEMPMLSGSRAELGQDAGKITWNNSVSYAKDKPLLATEDDKDEARRWLKGFGAWDAEEIAAWSDDELNALVVQFIAGDIRELESLCMNDDGEIDIDEAERLSEAGTIGGRLCKNDDGRWWFYLGD